MWTNSTEVWEFWLKEEHWSTLSSCISLSCVLLWLCETSLLYSSWSPLCCCNAGNAVPVPEHDALLSSTQVEFCYSNMTSSCSGPLIERASWEQQKDNPLKLTSVHMHFLHFGTYSARCTPIEYCPEVEYFAGTHTAGLATTFCANVKTHNTITCFMKYFYVLFNRECCDQGWHQFYRTPLLQNRTFPIKNILGKYISQKLQFLTNHEIIRFFSEICISSIFFFYSEKLTEISKYY